MIMAEGMEVMAAVLAVCSIKGGSGKTTLAFNLAERAAAAGLRVLLLDCDYQEAAKGLALLREEVAGDCWPVDRCPVTLAGAARARTLAEGGRYDLVLCDLPGSESMMLGGFLSRMDLVLAPVGVGAINVMAAGNFLALVRDLQPPVRLVFVANNFPRGRARLDALLEELGDRGGEVCPVSVQGRVAHVDMFYDGLGVCEKLPGSPAALEVAALWRWVAGQLGIEPMAAAAAGGLNAGGGEVDG